jgi:nucleoside-diphosphate-sugar epimerase
MHVVIGGGQVGTLVAEKLIARGERVRIVSRRDRGTIIEQATMMYGDMRDLRFAEEGTRGARVVYQCAAPPYDRWFDELQALVTGVIHGARTAGARLIVLDNLYMYGQVGAGPDGAEPFNEDTPQRPNSRKGVLRARLGDDLLHAHRRGDLQVAIGRAADFIGPGATVAIIMHEDFYRRALAGLPAQLIGDPTLPHAYAYTLDVAEALVTLGSRDEALGRVWHLPVLERTSTLALVERMQRALGAPVRHELLSDRLLAEIGQQNRVIAEIVEMTYQFKSPFIVDDTRIREAFGLHATPMDDVVRETARWARATFSKPLEAARYLLD